MEKKCAICYTNIDGDNAPILAMGGFGYPRLLCPECERLIESVSTTKDYDEFLEAKKSLASRCHPYLSDDKLTFDTVCSILDSSTERAEAIKSGTYDFSLDEVAEEDSFDEIPDDMKETEEDRLLDERDEEMSKKADKVLNWAMLGALIALIGFAVYFFFFR